MDKEHIRDYTARIAQANKSELVVIIYELFLVSLDEAEQKFTQDNLSEGVACVKRARGFLQELMGSLDMQYEISGELMRLYRYVYEQLIFSAIRRKIVQKDAVLTIMTKLKDAFTEVAKQDKSGSVMENTQQIYAGLTYGRDSLNEVLLNSGANRGFRI